MMEILKPATLSKEYRAWLWSDECDASSLMTRVQPNRSDADRPKDFCVNEPGRLPCTIVARGSQSVASRSMHTGGVTLSLCDGAVRYVSDTVDLTTWQSLSGMADDRRRPLCRRGSERSDARGVSRGNPRFGPERQAGEEYVWSGDLRDGEHHSGPLQRHNDTTTLRADVMAAGSNQFDYSLSTSPE